MRKNPIKFTNILNKNYLKWTLNMYYFIILVFCFYKLVLYIRSLFNLKTFGKVSISCISRFKISRFLLAVVCYAIHL